MLQCSKCSFLFTDPLQLTQKRSDDYWDHVITETEKSLEFTHVNASEREWIYAKKLVFEDTLRILSQFTPRKRILDVGCGVGYFVRYAADRGFDAWGIEPSPVACDFATQKLNLKHVRAGILNNGSYPPEFFDAIVFLNVLEHIPYPLEIVRIAYRLLSPGGIIFIRVPNIRFHMPLARLRRLLTPDRRYFLGPLDHVSQFSLKSLAMLLDACGFEPVQWLAGQPTLSVESNLGGKKSSSVGIGVKLAYCMATTMMFKLGGSRAYFLPTITAYARKAL